MSRFMSITKIGFQPQYDSPSASKTKDSHSKECNVITEMFSKGGFSSPPHTESSVAGIKEALQTGRMGLSCGAHPPLQAKPLA